MNSYPIGVFDSGVGGLTVYQALKKVLPNESFVYLGDTARVPYGTKTADTIIRYSLQAAEQLIHAHVKCLIIACNTATGPALPVLQKQYPDIPIIGVIEPGVQAALKLSVQQKIALIATSATVRAQSYEKVILAQAPKIKFFAKPAPLLVPLAEEGLLRGEIPQKIIHYYLDEWLALPDSLRPDTLILGCTHFPVLKQTIHQVVGNKMQIVDSAESVATAVKLYFDEHPHLKNTMQAEPSEFWVTDGAERFLHVAELFLQEKIAPSHIHLIDLL